MIRRATGAGLTRQVAVAGALLAIVATSTLLLLVKGIQDSRVVRDRSDTTLRTLDALNSLERMVISAETGERGFVITGQDRFLQPVRDARKAIPDLEAEVLAGLDGDERAVERFTRISEAIDRYVDGFNADTIAVARQSLARARAMVATGEGKRRLDALQRLFATLRAELRLEAQGRHDTVDASSRRLVVLGVAGIAIAMGTIGLFVLFITRWVVVPVRRVASAAGRLSRGDRSARVSGAETTRTEIGEMARAFNSMAAALQESHDELAAQQREVSHYAEELEAQRGELERTVAELEDEKARVEISSAFGEAVAAETRFGPLAELVLRRAAGAVRADAGALYVRDSRRGGELALASVMGVAPSLLPDIVHPGEGVAGRAVVERRPITASHEAARFRMRTLEGEVGLAHELHVPLMQAGEVFGVLAVGRLAGGAVFGEGDITVSSHLADQAAIALAKAVALRELRRREAITRAVLDATPEPIGLFDETGEPLLANEPMARCTELMRAHPVVAPDDGVVRDEIRSRSGRIFARYATVLDEPELRLNGMVLHDVTAEREADRLKDEFFALVSHELRTPLTSVVGYLELLREDAQSADGDDPGAAQRAHFLDVVDRNARRLLRLVGDLLFVAQVEAGKLRLETGEVDLLAVARESVETARPRAAQGGVELTLEAEELPVVEGDRDRLGQALDNLVSNAVKFTPEGGRVTVRLYRAQERAVMEVADTGMGISEADQQQLFQRFFRTESATAAAIPGVGLGLTIARAIVEGHEGRISVSSREGEGTTFHIDLPLRARVHA